METPKPKRKYRPTVKQVLVRDFNWRNGNLTRIKHSLGSLDPDVQRLIQVAIDIQVSRNVHRHQKRLLALEENNQSFIERDTIIQTALWEVARNISVDST